METTTLLLMHSYSSLSDKYGKFRAYGAGMTHCFPSTCSVGRMRFIVVMLTFLQQTYSVRMGNNFYVRCFYGCFEFLTIHFISVCQSIHSHAILIWWTHEYRWFFLFPQLLLFIRMLFFSFLLSFFLLIFMCVFHIYLWILLLPALHL